VAALFPVGALLVAFEQGAGIASLPPFAAPPAVAAVASSVSRCGTAPEGSSGDRSRDLRSKDLPGQIKTSLMGGYLKVLLIESKLCARFAVLL